MFKTIIDLLRELVALSKKSIQLQQENNTNVLAALGELRSIEKDLDGQNLGAVTALLQQIADELKPPPPTAGVATQLVLTLGQKVSQ
jgi:hypothetical protein